MEIDKGHRRRMARLNARLRQFDLAYRVGISQTALSLFENGQKDPSPEVARRLNEALGVRAYRVRKP